MSDVAIRQCLYLISKGFKEETAFSINEEFRIAFWIMLEELEGHRGKYLFDLGKFEKDE